jgi:hypothetical protein
MLINVVVSTFQKNTDWTDKFDKTKFNVIKYTKDPQLPETDTNIPINRGNEASAYLKHIVDNYENLSDKTVFLHDEEYSWHHKGSIVNKVNENTNVTYVNLNSSLTGSMLTHKHFKEIINDYYKPCLEKYIGPHTLYGDWTKGRLGCAQFVIDKSIILKNPKQMYIDLYNWILSSSFGEKVGERNIEAKFMEWTWDLIFISDQLRIK